MRPCVRDKFDQFPWRHSHLLEQSDFLIILLIYDVVLYIAEKLGGFVDIYIYNEIKYIRLNRGLNLMKIDIKNIRESGCACDALILPMPEGKAAGLDRLGSAASVVKKVLSREFSGKKNDVLLLQSPDNFAPGRLLLVGLGPQASITDEVVRQAGGRAVSYLRDLGMKKIALSTTLLSDIGRSPVDFVEGGILGTYTFGRYKSEKDAKEIGKMTILSRPTKELGNRLRWMFTVTDGVRFSRDLINTPSNDMTPTRLAKVAASLKGRRLSVRTLDRREAQKLGMGAYLAVARGSHEPPRFIVLHYRGGKGAPLVLIGKSITFDSGGISLKPADGMEKMKYDMAGGAAVLGVMKALSESGLPMNVVGILPATENLPGGSATKPGDIVRALGGKTIEIINTDAEGRLVIADAIGYARRLKPRGIIDIATLTGACSIAFGNEAAAMMGNDKALIDGLRHAGDETYERVWEMPLYDEYRDYLKSDTADIQNTGGRTGSLMTSAYFLKEFAGDTPWVHIDIAGTAWAEKPKPYLPKGATAVGVRLLLAFLKGFK